MDSQTDSLFTEAMKLSPLQREELVVRLMGSLDDELGDVSLHPDWDGEIARRIEEIRSGTAKTIPADEVHRRLRTINDA